MATPRTQNWRSSSADRSTRLACVPWQVALITLILTVCSAAVAANRIGRSNLICAVVSIRLVTGVLALIAAGRWIVHPHLVLHWISQVQWRAALAVLMLAAMFTATAAKAQTITLLSAGGATIAGGTNVYTSSFGNMNALGAGTAGAGMSVTSMSNGALYYTEFQMHAAGIAGRTGTVTAYVSTNFTHTPAVTMYACPSSLTCTSSANYSVLSTSAAAPTTLGGPGMANNSSVTGGLAIFVPDNDGASAFAGTNTVTITFTLTRSGNPVRTDTATLTITAVTQTAVQLTLGTAPGGATIAAGSDFSLNFGNVNGLGIGPAGGLTATSVAGGYVYSTPYLLQPAFAELSSTTATIKVAVSTNFAHPTQLILQDATASAGPFTAIPISPATARTLTSTAADRSPITRYLGLFVSNANGPTIYTGSDNATLTFTLTVP